jgi:hypothetical protein
MGLIGRLEDLPLSDIIQIVHLSRRTGLLEIKKDGDEYKIFFQKGMIVFCSSPDYPDFVNYIKSSENLDSKKIAELFNISKKMPDEPLGKLAVELHYLSIEEMAKIIFKSINEIIQPLLQDKEGTFSFYIKDIFPPQEIGYIPEDIFKTGGLPPSSILQKGGEISVLKEVQENLTRGKEAYRGEYKPKIEEAKAEVETKKVPLTELIPKEIDIKSTATASPVEKVLGKFSIMSKEEEEKIGGLDIVILEQDPLLRVAVKRIFAKEKFKVHHYNSVLQFENKVKELRETEDYFIVVIGVSQNLNYEISEKLLSWIKAGNSNLCYAIVLHPEYEIEMQHRALKSGADVILQKPDFLRISPQEAERAIQLFSEEIFIIVQRYLKSKPEFQEKTQFHDIATKEKLNRSISLLKHLIEELAEPTDPSQIFLMILRIAAEYLERAVVLLCSEDEFLGIGGFGLTGDEIPMNIRVRSIAIPKEADTIFSQIYQSRKVHRGKLKRTTFNEKFINSLGKVFPNEVIVIPIVFQKKVLSILYGDNAEFKRPIGNTDGLELFLAQAGPSLYQALSVYMEKNKAYYGV